MKEFSLEELAQYNGENGKPVYVAHAGKVYDVGASKMWKTGSHMKRHRSGMDLTTDIQAAPHTPDVLGRFPQVGVLTQPAEAAEHLPAFLGALLKQFPFLRRHPHPMTVHFPIVFMLSTTAFSLIYLVTGEKSFDSTAFHCLGAGVFFNVVAIATGFYTWWLNYLAKPIAAVRIKIPLALHHARDRDRAVRLAPECPGHSGFAQRGGAALHPARAGAFGPGDDHRLVRRLHDLPDRRGVSRPIRVLACRRMRSVLPITVKLLQNMATAATTGLSRPAIASGSASRL